MQLTSVWCSFIVHLTVHVLISSTYDSTYGAVHHFPASCNEVAVTRYCCAWLAI